MQIDNEILKVIEDLFIVRNDCYPQQIDFQNVYMVVKEDFTREVIRRHLRGAITVGSFQIDPKTNKVKWICFDFDGDLKEEFEKAKKLFIRLQNKGFNPLLEFSGRRGYHIWLFVEPISASIAKSFAKNISEGIEPHEIFPKTDKINHSGYGAQVKIPLGIHRASNKRSYFFDSNFNSLSLGESKKLLLKFKNGRRDVIESSLEKFLVNK